jgi:hypothetical protein
MINSAGAESKRLTAKIAYPLAKIMPKILRQHKCIFQTVPLPDLFDRDCARCQRFVGQDIIDLAHNLSLEWEDGDGLSEIGSATWIAGMVSIGDAFQRRNRGTTK